MVPKNTVTVPAGSRIRLTFNPGSGSSNATQERLSKQDARLDNHNENFKNVSKRLETLESRSSKSSFQNEAKTASYVAKTLGNFANIFNN
ncbi:hypothetical protein MMC18_005709 [Xylographa bjoerkii]|nr:hypothetical protein [Xylographa bjoerkii]